jgi:orotidine-5'-phosphate decarboxylase
MFIDKLIEAVKEKDNPTVVGLDPKIEYVPSLLREEAFREYGKNLKGVAHAILSFNKKIIDAVYDIVPAVKPQLAYYEMYGIEGLKVFDETVKYSKEKGLIVIADGKRNDIGSTAQSYSSAYLGKSVIDEGIEESVFDVDALTVNPYLGVDGIKPFIDDCKKYKKGVFILVKTSNKSSGQIQDLFTQLGKSIYEIVAELVEEWGKPVRGQYGYSSVGAVVGATYPNQAKILRKAMQHAYILVPGYGAQGGTARDVAHSFNGDGLGAIVNASRSIMCAYQSDEWKNQYNEEQFAEASRAEAIRMRNDINSVIKDTKL